MTEFVLNEEIYQRVIQQEIPQAQRFVWIITADIKDLHVERTKGRYAPFLGVLAELVSAGVEVRLVHAKEPGPRFRRDFDKYPELRKSDGFERILCVRNHIKAVIIDGYFAYLGSANLTGAGMGAKSPKRRNFEAGIVTTDPAIITPLIEFCDRFYLGDFCIACQRRDVCPDPIV